MRVGSAPMTVYRCYFLDDESHVVGVDVIDCPDDEAAKVKAAKALLRSSEKAAEVWDHQRWVAYFDRATARTIAS
jgi:hypothetical protein